jgi:hypothetical protein
MDLWVVSSQDILSNEKAFFDYSGEPNALMKKTDKSQRLFRNAFKELCLSELALRIGRGEKIDRSHN